MGVFKVDRPERRKAVPGYGGRYEVSNLGRVYSGGLELTAVLGRYVYLHDRGQADRASVCYLVARAFVPNPEGRPFVRHRNGLAGDNRAENLEWCEKRERCGRPAGRKENRRKVVAYDRETGEFVGKWDSVKNASEALGVARCLIRNCAEGRARRAKGYVFRYV